MDKETDIIIRTLAGNTESIHVKEVVKQSTIFGSITCFKETSTVSSIEELKYGHCVINIGIPVFMDDIATASKAEHIRKGINNCATMKKKR